MSTISQSSKKPIWQAPFSRFVRYTGDAENLVRLTHVGVERLTMYPQLFEILGPSEGEDEQAHITKIEAAQERADLAREEVEKEFPLLHAHTLMGLWGALEALVEDLCVAWLDHRPDVLARPTLARIRLPLSEYESMARDDRMRFLITEAQRDLKVDFRQGVSQFEALLDALGLSGPVDPRVRDTLFQGQQVRNILAHRAGIADRRFVERCPQFGYVPGELVTVGHELFAKFFHAFLVYALTLQNRCRVQDGEAAITTDLPGFEGALEFG